MCCLRILFVPTSKLEMHLMRSYMSLQLHLAIQRCDEVMFFFFSLLELDRKLIHLNLLQVGHLVVDNSDYIIDFVCQQLRHLDLNPHVPSVLAAILSYIGAAHNILPLLEEPVSLYINPTLGNKLSFSLLELV